MKSSSTNWISCGQPFTEPAIWKPKFCIVTDCQLLLLDKQEVFNSYQIINNMWCEDWREGKSCRPTFVLVFFKESGIPPFWSLEWTVPLFITRSNCSISCCHCLLSWLLPRSTRCCCRSAGPSRARCGYYVIPSLCPETATPLETKQPWPQTTVSTVYPLLPYQTEYTSLHYTMGWNAYLSINTVEYK